MAEEKMNTVQFDAETDRKLNLVAKAYRRSKAAQVVYLIESEYEKLAAVKLLPTETPENQAKA